MDTGPYIGNPNLARQGKKARENAAKRGVDTLPDPRTYAFVSGLLGTPPDQQGFSVLRPDLAAIRSAGEAGFGAGLLAQVAPMGAAAKPVAKALAPTAAGMAENYLIRTGLAQPIFIGENAKTWKAGMAAKAVEMEKAGAQPIEIWKQTGTFRGPDGKLRQEIPDHKARLLSPADMQANAARLTGRNAEIKQQLADSKGYPDLFPKELAAAQKELRAEAKANKGLLDDVHGPLADEKYIGNRADVAFEHPALYEAYPELREVIVRRGADMGPGVQGRFTGSELEISREGLVAGDPRLTMLHEMQHAVQGIEKFAPGGAPAAMLPEQFAPQFQKAMQAAQDAGDFRAFNQAKREGAMDAYQRLAGEAEARATEQRAGLGNLMRQQTFPLRSYDRLPKDLILDPQATGPSYALAPKRYQGNLLDGLPEAVEVNGRMEPFGTDQRIVDIAGNYLADKGMRYSPLTQYTPLDAERGKRLAAAFEAMQHNPTDPAVRASYAALARETQDQYEALLRAGYKFDFIRGADPYGNPRNAINDIVLNKHMSVFPTEAGFGGPASTGVDITGNPLMGRSGLRIGNDPSTTYNDLFRAVHDVFGHAKHGVGFRARGEENAFQSHARMYSPEALPAATSETRGQNSWVNFGPYGERNRVASPVDTEYAPQKTGLLPRWTYTEGLDPALAEMLMTPAGLLGR